MSESLNKVTLSRTDTATIATVLGEIDISSAPEFRAAITEAIQTSTLPVVVIDLTGVTFLGSPALAALITAEAQAAERRVRLGVVTGGNRIVLRPLQITGLDMSIPIHETLADLEVSLDSPSQGCPG
jgi:anti-sigma B factor antagonist